LIDYAAAPQLTAAMKATLGKKGKKAAATAAAWALLQSDSQHKKSKAPLHPSRSMKPGYGKGFAH